LCFQKPFGPTRSFSYPWFPPPHLLTSLEASSKNSIFFSPFAKSFFFPRLWLKSPVPGALTHSHRVSFEDDSIYPPSSLQGPAQVHCLVLLLPPCLPCPANTSFIIIWFHPGANGGPTQVPASTVLNFLYWPPFCFPPFQVIPQGCHPPLEVICPDVVDDSESECNLSHLRSFAMGNAPPLFDIFATPTFVEARRPHPRLRRLAGFP